MIQHYLTISRALSLSFFLLSGLPGRAQEPFSAAHASWIRPSGLLDADSVCPIFVKNFRVDMPIKAASLSVTAHGLYIAQINGARVGTAYFSPGFTNYLKLQPYQEYDVRSLVHSGENAIQVMTAGGWFRGVFGGDNRANRYGSHTSLLLVLRLELVDGSSISIVSDSSWRVGDGPVRSSALYAGECVDHRVRAGNWGPVLEEAGGAARFVRPEEPAVSVGERIPSRRVFVTPKGEQVIDFGQNLAGWVQIRVKGNAGDTVTVDHAEMLDSVGNFYTGNLREARARDIYILKGGEREVFAPSFTYHGFRYVRIRGADARGIEAVAVAVHNALPVTGRFRCSDPMVNQLQQNIEWSLNSNFLAIPTDCPQRSERLGWTGDAQVFIRTASYLRNVDLFFRSWLESVVADQGTDGGVPAIIPDIYRIRDTVKNGVAGWGDAMTIIPWTLYQVYNDTTALRRYYPAMRRWVEHIREKSPDGKWKAGGYGDWYAQGDATSLPFIDECFYALSTKLLMRTAGVLGYKDDSARYGRLLDTVKRVFDTAYSKMDTRDTRTQTAFVLALAFDMLPEAARQGVADRLAAAVRANDYHLATGFLGTPYLLPVLSSWGYDSLAYRLLLQKTCPSWLYPITRGATTIWERWDAVRPDSSLQQTSFNHYAYGAVGDWLYRYVLGIDAMEPGYRKIRIAPHPGGGLQWAEGSYDCAFGRIGVRWRLRGNRFSLDIRVPEGISGEVMMPGGEGAGRSVGGQQSFPVGPGKHRFSTLL